ncbi:glycosyl hydrolase [Baekduia soli]|uniref:glycosyl hydrolase n=1 Tax=Baekduia soli TaxID=496014 RepID=UPI0016522A75|nr:glycosyl hydrolase [Baekduia soli]
MLATDGRVRTGRRARGIVLALLAGMVTTLAAGAPAHAAPLVGIQSGGILSSADTAEANDRELAAEARLHVKVVRFEVSWAALEPRASGERDPAVLAKIDAFVDGAARRGIRPILFIDRTPCWASSAPADVRGDCSGPDANRDAVWRYAPADPVSAVPVATFLSQRYGTRLAAFQLWNEPDQSNEKYWAGPNKIAGYVAFAKALYPALKAVSPTVPVLAGSFVGADGRWLTALYKAGIKGSYDGIAVQFYDLPLYALRTTRAVQRKYGDTAPLWMTEFGYTSCSGRNGRPTHAADHPCVTQAVQAQNLGDVFAAVSRTSWVKATVVYALYDESSSYQFGVIDRQGRHKPSYSVVSRAGKARRLRTQRMHLTRRGRSIRVAGTAPGIDIYTMKVSIGGVLRYRAIIRPNRLNRFTVTLPAVLGTGHMKVTLRRQWDGRTVGARR